MQLAKKLFLIFNIYFCVFINSECLYSAEESTVSADTKEMVTPLIRKNLEKQGNMSFCI